MDRKEAISHIENYVKACRLVEDSEIIRALEMAIVALDRLTLKKPIYFKSYREWRCRGCHCILKAAYSHCPTCGQALDWMGAYRERDENNEAVGN